MSQYFIILLIFLFINPSLQQSCVKYDTSLLTEPCSSITPTSWMYLDQGKDLNTEIAIINQVAEGLKQYPILPGCTQTMLEWNCYVGNPIFTTYNPAKACAVNVFNTPVIPIIKVPACRDMCDKFIASCLPYFAYAGLGDAYIGYCNQYTNNDTIVNGNIVKCWNSTTEYNLTKTNRTCPYYTVPYKSNVSMFNGSNEEYFYDIRTYYANDSDSCDNRCPSPEYTDEQLQTIALLQQITAWISFVLASIVIILYMINKEYRTFPSRIVAWLIVATMPLSLGFMLITFMGGSVTELWCGNKVAYPNEKLIYDNKAINNTGICVFQGWLIVYGTLSIAAWWSILSYNTYQTIKTKNFVTKRMQLSKIETIYHIIGWGIPLILVIIPTAAQEIVYEATYIYCFISTADNQAWIIACWFVPIGIFLLAGSVFLGSCIFHIIKNIKNMGLNKTKMDRLIRLVSCLLTFWVMVIIIIASQILNMVNEVSNYNGILYYTTCLSGNGSEEDCRAQLLENTNLTEQYGLNLSATFFMAAMGTFMALIFGTTPRIIDICNRNVSEFISSRTSNSGSRHSGSINSLNKSSSNSTGSGDPVSRELSGVRVGV